MSFKPSDLYLGIVDVFVLLLPGVILVDGLSWLFARPLPTGGERLFTHWLPLAYAAGLGVSTIGSALEDLLGSTIGKWRIDREKIKLASLRTRTAEILGGLLVMTEHDICKDLRRTAALVGRNVGVSGEPISRRDADRRFARNAVVVMLALVAVLPWATRTDNLIHVASVALPIAAMVAIWRYFDQDSKYSREVYEWLIVQYAFGHLMAKGVQQPLR